MNLELNDAGMTFLVGAFVILSIEALGYFVFGRDIFRFFQGQIGLASGADAAPPAVTAGVFIGLSFALGLLVEDVCHKYDDSNVDWPFRVAYEIANVGSADNDESDLKAALHQTVLVKDLRKSHPVLTGLGREVFSSGIFEIVLGPTHGMLAPAWALRGGPLPPGTMADVYAGLHQDMDVVFYFCKNRVYHEKNYFDEMSRIQLRVDFSRTITTFSLVACCLTLALGLVALARVRGDRKFVKAVASRVALLTLTFATIYAFGYQAYLRESKEFNKRAYGYYNSMLICARTSPDPHTRATLP